MDDLNTRPDPFAAATSNPPPPRVGNARGYMPCVIVFKNLHGPRLAGGEWRERMRALLAEAEALYRDAPRE